MDAATNTHKGKVGRDEIISMMDARSVKAEKSVATSSENALLAAMKGQAKLKKIRKYLKMKAGNRPRPRPWESPQPFRRRRASIFGSIKSVDENIVIDMR